MTTKGVAAYCVHNQLLDTHNNRRCERVIGDQYSLAELPTPINKLILATGYRFDFPFLQTAVMAGSNNSTSDTKAAVADTAAGPSDDAVVAAAAAAASSAAAVLAAPSLESELKSSSRTSPLLPSSTTLLRTLRWDDNHVRPLHDHIFCIEDPSLAFVGLPWKVVPFPLFELQARCVRVCARARVCVCVCVVVFPRA